MGGGLDLLIVGVAGKNLDHIASNEELNRLFGRHEETGYDVDDYFKELRELENNPLSEKPVIFYLEGEIYCGWQNGAGLGYLISDGNHRSPPKKIDDRVFKRIDELKARFIDETREAGLHVPVDEVGVYVLNVYDT